MKKLLFVLASFLAFHQAQAQTYETLDRSPSAKPEVLEFFSFYCPHCYDFQYVYKIPEKIEESLPKGVEFKQYHVSFSGPRGAFLTRVWALANVLGVQDKVREPLFDVVRKAAKARDAQAPTLEDVQAIFLNAGVTQEEFNAINSFAVSAMFNKQEKLAEILNVQGVPDFYVNEKYRLNPEGMPRTPTGFVNGYVETVKDLLQK